MTPIHLNRPTMSQNLLYVASVYIICMSCWHRLVFQRCFKYMSCLICGLTTSSNFFSVTVL
jgi:ribosomal protein S27E